MKKYALTIKVGLLTASAIVLFQAISLLVVYQYVRMDLYLGVVAVCFLLLGLFINRAKPAPVQSTQNGTGLLQQLTNRELQVLQLIAAGKTNKEIAALQYVEISTVKTHVNNIYGKLGVGNRKEARSKYTEIIKNRE